MNAEKNCPPGKVLNPVTGRCVKADGRIGKTLITVGVDKKCKSGEILNPATGRCVKIDGKIGRNVVQMRQKYMVKPESVSKLIGVIFKPSLSILVNSSFDTGRSGSSLKRKNIWDKITIKQYLNWYNAFKSDIIEKLQNNYIQFLGFSVHSKTHLLLKLKVPGTIHSGDIKTLGDNDAVKYALNPDVDETRVVLYKNVIHLVETEEIKKIFLI